jgi:secondary thiamine-phosphate synthase enzyme
MIFEGDIRVNTKGDTDIVDITGQVQQMVSKSGIRSGLALVFVSGSTAGITTVEYEPGLISDLRDAYQRLAPRNGHYGHDSRWGDGNGYAHVRASLTGGSFTAPVRAGSVVLGTWQQIVLVDFDNRPRARSVLVQVIGE